MKVRSVLAAVAAAVSVSALAAVPASAIVGGVESPHAYPFTGALIRPGEGPSPDGQVCGVTLIAPQWVVTASHCARNTYEQQVGQPDDWSVRLGSTSKTSGGELIPIEKYARRSNGPQLHYVFGKDIALLKLAHPAKAKPIGVATSTPAAGTPARIIGWGSTCADKACYPAELREADTQVQATSTCQVSLTDLCIGAVDGSVGPANLDSGGPALVKNGADWVLAGVVSGGDTNSPGIYTDVATYRDWIAENTAAERHPTLEGVARLDGCSGSIVRKRGSAATDPALLLTNGHCVKGDRPAVGSAVTNRAEARDVTVEDAAGNPKSTVHTMKLLYATMTGTDIALYQLDKTYAQLGGVKVFDLGTSEAAQAEQVNVLSGNAKKAWACAVANIVPELREGGYSLHHAIQYTEDCSPGGGDSGSPIVDAHTGQVVGIHNTSNGQGGVCTDGNPCEVDEDGVVFVHMSRSYGEQTSGIPACLGAGSTVDLSLSGCGLTKPKA
ncbi:trypsin-like serine protease [Amycolatopsis sp. FDAARGOS 1241]|uniref:trypsin-like serine protease n=1 Tax=Amycolatopsis sp. FDAARGOS 1241 TaxID=2778070 RepID=UPI00195179DC|nr:trypsin-like serine protease [Amycolatopsis sp. FDAARGOS 1241]QRP47806.1 trypsin-like serine protease [Amycolatopsis sp. FDAARGOS 1241]